MGVGAQLPMWPDGFCAQLLKQGYRVIRFDHRDSGLSTEMRGRRAEGSIYPRLLRYVVGRTSPVPYTAVGPGQRCEGAARPPQHRVHTRGRRVDGRDDRPGAGRQPAGPHPDAGPRRDQLRLAVVVDPAVAGDQAGVRPARQGRAVGGQARIRGPQHRSSTAPTSCRQPTSCAVASRS
jgi:hypothetical protein